MPSFMPGHQLLPLASRIFILKTLRRGLLHADLQPVNGKVDLIKSNNFFFPARRHDGRLVHEVLEGGSREADGARRDRFQVDVGRERLVSTMNLEDFYSAGLVREVDRDPSVEAARSQQSVVQNISSVRRGDDDDARVAGEAVHLREDLVQRLFSLVVRREASTAGPLAANRVDLINKNDARRVLFGISKQ